MNKRTRSLVFYALLLFSINSLPIDDTYESSKYNYIYIYILILENYLIYNYIYININMYF